MLERALQANPGHAALIHASSMLQYNRKDADLLCSEVSHAALSAVELHERGRQESDRGNHSEARTLFSHALKKDPTMPHTYVRWARMESKLDVQKAIEIYLEGYTSCHPSQLFRSEPPINSNGINAAVGDKGGLNTNSSLSHFQRQAKRFIPLLHSWASLEESQGRLTKARALLKEALQLDPGHVPSWMSLGRVIWSLGGAEEGRKVWGLGCEVVGPSAPLLHQWSQKELRAGGNIQTHKTIEEQRGEAKSSDALPNLANSSAAEGSNATFQSIKAESSSASTADAIKMNNGNKDEKPLDLFSPDALNRWPSNLIKPWKSLSWSTAPTAAAARSRARALLALALEIDRKHGPSIQASAALEDRSGLVQKSDAIYKAHLSNSLDGTFPQLLHSRAIQLLKRGEREQALNLLSQLSSAHPHNAHLCHTLGILAQQVRHITLLITCIPSHP
jgi:tetratricopeptide (TPR) repeat protein